MKYREALSSLRFKKSNKYALVGNENYLKEHFIKKVAEVYSESGMSRMFPDEEQEALSILRSDNFFNDRIVVLNYFDRMNVKNFEKVIESYDGGLLLVLSDKADLKTRIMTQIFSMIPVVECIKFREYGTDYLTWIQTHIIEFGYKMSDKVDELIYTRIGPNLYRIAHELEKLYILKFEDKVITEKDVRDSVSITCSSTAFELFENLFKRDIVKALKSFNSYTKNHESLIEIVTFIGSYLEKMYRILLFREREFDIDDIANIVGIPKFLLKIKYMPWALAFGKNNIASKIDSICDLIIKLRLFKGDKKILFERFIFSFSK